MNLKHSLFPVTECENAASAHLSGRKKNKVETRAIAENMTVWWLEGAGLLVLHHPGVEGFQWLPVYHCFSRSLVNTRSHFSTWTLWCLARWAHIQRGGWSSSVSFNLVHEISFCRDQCINTFSTWCPLKKVFMLWSCECRMKKSLSAPEISRNDKPWQAKETTGVTRVLLITIRPWEIQQQILPFLLESAVVTRCTDTPGVMLTVIALFGATRFR